MIITAKDFIKRVIEAINEEKVINIGYNGAYDFNYNFSKNEITSFIVNKDTISLYGDGLDIVLSHLDSYKIEYEENGVYNNFVLIGDNGIIYLEII